MKQFQKAFFAFIVTKLIKSKVNNKFECIIEEVSDNFLHLFNLEFEETINNNLFSILPQFPYNDWVVQLNEINGSNSIELKFKVKNVQYQIYSYKIFDNSSIVSMIIPDLVNEEFLNKENDFDFIYDKYFKNFPFNVFVFDENGTFLKANHRFCQTIGYHSDELIGKNLYDIKLVLPCDYKQMEIKKNPYSKKKYSDTIKFKRKNGTNLYFEISSIIHVNLLNICFLNDITSKTIKNIIDRTIIKFIDFSMTSNSKELMQKFLNEFEMLTESKIGFFHFVSNDQKGLSLQTWSTNTLKNMCNAKGENSHYPIDEAGVWVDCIRLKRPVIHNDYENICHKKGMPEGHAKVIRELVIPIFRKPLYHERC
jgi:PAS domain S-box-containing protein